MKVKDYLHLYLGCDVQTPDLIGKYLGPYYATEINEFNGVNILYPEGKIYVQNFNQVKPILRPLSDMTYEEANKSFEIFRTNEEDFEMPAYHYRAHSAQTKYLLSKHFDLFNLIENGLAIDSTQLNQPIK